MAAEEAKISVKVMVHKAKNKAMFFEANGDFVDILFSFMTLPLGTIVRILGKCRDEKARAVPSLKNLYNSLTNLPDRYVTTEESKYMMLNPRSSSYDHCRKLKLNIDDTNPPIYYTCEGSMCSSFSNRHLTKCNDCDNVMDWAIDYNHLTADPEGDAVDDFLVQLLRDQGITDASLLEERTLDIGQDLVNLRRETLVNLRRETLVQLLIGYKVEINSKRMTIKVSLQKSTSKFLFAEAEEDFVEFIFGFLEIPLATVIGILKNGRSTIFIGSLENIITSISNMEVGKYIKSQDLKVMLLKPQLEHKFPRVNDPRVEGRLLKKSGKFMLMDDLVITPLSSFSTILLLNKLKVPLNDVEQHEVSIGIEEGLKILESFFFLPGNVYRA